MDWPDQVARSYLDAEVLDANQGTITTEGTSLETTAHENGYQATVLGHRSARGYEVTGLALFVLEPTSVFSPPYLAATALSACAVEAGDSAILVTSVSDV